MSKNFWQKLNSSHFAPTSLKLRRASKASRDSAFFCLAPMYDVTDAAFRQMFVKYGRPDVLFTEFVSADGLASDEGRPKLLRELYFTKKEHPIVAQIFGARPENIEIAAKLVKELGFDGLDINMGCPDKAVEKQSAGAALIKNPKLAQEIILSAKKVGLPVSIKTRIGYSKFDPDWLKAIREARPDAVTFHLRTRKELSDVDAHWELWPQIAEIFQGSGIVLIANGDVKNVKEGKELAEKYGIAGIMVGRGVFGKPWFFSGQEKTLPEKLKIMLEHTKLFWDLYRESKNFAVMRKHFKAYVSGFKGATALRAQLMRAENFKEVEKIVKDFLKTI